MILWGGQLRKLFKDEVDDELLQLKKQEQDLTAKVIGKLSEQHERLLQELRQTRKKLRVELERSQQVEFTEKTEVLNYLNQTAQVRLADDDDDNNDEVEDDMRHNRIGQQFTSPSRRKLPLRNNFLTSSNASKAGITMSLSSPSRHLPKRALAKSTPLPHGAKDRGSSPSRRKWANLTAGSTSLSSTSSVSLSTGLTAKAKYDILPILTSTGESVFEVGLDKPVALSAISSSSQEHKLPVFRLPTVTSLEFVNRIPRDDTMYEKALRQREKEEFEYMKKQLGLSTQEIRELEQVLGLRDPERPASGERVNEVRRFIEQQMMLPPLATKQLRAKAFKRRRIRRNERLAGSKAAETAEELMRGETPRCLREGAKASREELQKELEKTITVMRAYSGAIKDDVMTIKQLCGITHPRAKRFLKQWAAEKLARIMEDLMFSAVVISWERWKQKVQLQKKMERISAYLKFQSSQRLKNVFEGWVHRHMAGAFLTWKRLVQGQKDAERKILEIKNAKVLQRVFRGYKSRKRVAQLKIQHQAAKEKAAVTKIQAFARGYIVRCNLPNILREAERRRAATTIQCMVRQRLARKKVRILRIKRARFIVALHLQCLYRGARDRARAASIKHKRLQVTSVIKIQRMARIYASRKILSRLKRQQARNRAATIIQKHIRAMLARCRVRAIRKRNADEKIARAKAAVLIQRVYRGHRARLRFNLELKVRGKKRGEAAKAARQIQRVIRGFNSRRQAKRMRIEAENALMDNARAWVEAWDATSSNWGYFSREDGHMLAEPPRSGYTKSDGRLVLATGKVINDPLTSMTEEEQMEKQKDRRCVECEAKDANRLCKQCGDKYCTICYNKTHNGGKRASHTYVQIGPIDCSECEQEIALRWCTSCDDPFCDSCWSLIHLRGKRLRHAFCEIDRKGNVSLNAIGPDGQFAGTFKAGQTGAGYGSDYGMDGYASDYAGAENLGMEVQANDEWAEYMDEQGVKYWYNNKTGLSQWHDPTEKAPNRLPTSPSSRAVTSPMAAAEPGAYVSADGYASEGYEGGQGFGVEPVGANPWTQYADENGVPYWYNSITGESTYTSPSTAGGAGTGTDWMEATDDLGNVYYYNTVTGQSQYEYPY